MPQFKSTYNILKKYDEDEAYESKWFEYDTLQLPPKVEWDYQRELNIEDVDLWEVMYEASGGIGLYVAWMPYAEFYMFTTGVNYQNATRFNEEGTPYYDRYIETYYGQGAQKAVFERAKELGIDLTTHTVWVEQEDLWLYQDQPAIKKVYHL